MGDYKPAEKILDEVHGKGAAFWERDVEGWRKKFEQEPNSAVPAFEALSIIALALQEFQGDASEPETEPTNVDPDQLIAVPAWIVTAIVIGWNEYMEHRDTRKMEQAFGIQPMKPGSRSRLETEATVQEKKEIALEVAQIVGAEQKWGSIRQAIETVADRRGAGDDDVRKAWQKYGRLALERLKAAPAIKS